MTENNVVVDLPRFTHGIHNPHDFDIVIYDKNYMRIQFKVNDLNNNKEYLISIPKISLSTVALVKDQLYNSVQGQKDIMEDNMKLTFNVHPENNRMFGIIDITSPKEMTLNEIEHKLGYKVKIVSKKTNNDMSNNADDNTKNDN